MPNSDAEFGLSLLRSVRRGNMQVGIGGHELLALDADSHTITLELGAIPSPAVPSGRTLAGQAFQSLRDPSSARALGRALNDIGWTVRIQYGGRDVARLGKGVSSVTGHMTISLDPLPLLDFTRRHVKRLFERVS